jgi:hypothetical protein
MSLVTIRMMVTANMIVAGTAFLLIALMMASLLKMISRRRDSIPVIAIPEVIQEIFWSETEMLSRVRRMGRKVVVASNITRISKES